MKMPDPTVLSDAAWPECFTPDDIRLITVLDVCLNNLATDFFSAAVKHRQQIYSVILASHDRLN